MQRVEAKEINRIVVEDVPVPEPGPGEVRVNTIYAGICGSDTHALAGDHTLLRPPYVPGHEAVGSVDALGPDVAGLTVGQRVVLKPNVPCGACVNCLAGRTNACQNLEWVGCDSSGKRPGACADKFIAPAENLFPVSDDISDRQAALVECFGTPIHAVRLAGDLTGARVVVQGGGTIGILVAVAALDAGAGKVVVTDLDPSKRERAERLGAVAGVDGAAADAPEQVVAALGGLADVVFDCVAAEVSARQWTSMVRKAAKIIIVGVAARDYALPVPLIMEWELTIQGSANYTAEDIAQAIKSADKIPVDDIISAEVPFSQAVEAFERAAQHDSGKVLLHPESKA